MISQRHKKIQFELIVQIEFRNSGAISLQTSGNVFSRTQENISRVLQRGFVHQYLHLFKLLQILWKRDLLDLGLAITFYGPFHSKLSASQDIIAFIGRFKFPLSAKTRQEKKPQTSQSKKNQI